MNKISVIDIGSNSVKMRIGLFYNKKLFIIHDETEVTKLARSINNSLIPQENMFATLDAIKKMIANSKQYNVNELILVGTMALRIAKNSDDFIKLVNDITGYKIQILSGEQEAKYSWLGAIHGFCTHENILMFDTGGGSTEFVLGHNKKIMNSISVPIGAVNISEKFFYEKSIVKRKTLDEALNFINQKFIEYGIKNLMNKNCFIIGVGGGVVAMAGVKSGNENFFPPKLHGMILTQRDVINQINLYSSLTLAERQNIIGLPVNRADIILGSACIVHEILKLFSDNKCSFTVSINGLRNGILINKFFGSEV